MARHHEVEANGQRLKQRLAFYDGRERQQHQREEGNDRKQTVVGHGASEKKRFTFVKAFEHANNKAPWSSNDVRYSVHVASRSNLHECKHFSTYGIEPHR